MACSILLSMATALVPEALKHTNCCVSSFWVGKTENRHNWKNTISWNVRPTSFVFSQIKWNMIACFVDIHTCIYFWNEWDEASVIVLALCFLYAKPQVSRLAHPRNCDARLVWRSKIFTACCFARGTRSLIITYTECSRETIQNLSLAKRHIQMPIHSSGKVTADHVICETLITQRFLRPWVAHSKKVDLYCGQHSPPVPQLQRRQLLVPPQREQSTRNCQRLLRNSRNPWIQSQRNPIMIANRIKTTRNKQARKKVRRSELNWTHGPKRGDFPCR